MPGQLQGRKQPEGQEDEEEDFTFISLSSVRHDVLPGTQQHQDDAHGQGEQTAGGAAGQQAAAAVRQPAVNTPRTEHEDSCDKKTYCCPWKVANFG